jgi:hypothetical protein
VPHEALLRQRTSIVAELELEIPDMVSCDGNLELGHAPGVIGGLHVAHCIVTLVSGGGIPADSVLILGVGVRSKRMHIAGATTHRAILIHVPGLRDRHAPMAFRDTGSGNKNQGGYKTSRARKRSHGK